MFLAVFASAVCFAATADSASESKSAVEVRVGKTVTTGKLLARGKDKATLLDRAGQLHDVDMSASTLKTLKSNFQSLSVTELRNQLAREFGKDFEIGTTRHYLVVAPRGKATSYAAVFEDQYSTMLRYFKTRGFSLTEPSFSLMAIVFPNRQQFMQYAQADGAKAMAGMAGYYSPRTNRVALFESSEKSVALSDSLQLFSETHRLGFGSTPFGSLAADLKSTMVHEATHQVAYNIGLHSRLGETPRWVVEGMATVFEPDGVRDSSAGWNVKQRINRDRYLSFLNYAKNRRPPKSLKSFVEGDSLYESAVPDFYGQSWALSFFLIETRPRNYSAYVKRIAARDPFADYRAAERLADFKDAFQTDLDLLDAQFLRFMDGLK